MATAKTPAKKAAPKKTETKPTANSCGAKDKCLPPEVAKKIAAKKTSAPAKKTAAKKPAAPVALPSLVRVNLAELGAGAVKHIDAFFDMKNVPSSWKGVIISEPVQQTVQVEKELLVNVHTVQVTRNDGQLTKSRTRAAQWLRGLAAEYNASVWLRTA